MAPSWFGSRSAKDAFSEDREQSDRQDQRWPRGRKAEAGQQQAAYEQPSQHGNGEAPVIDEKSDEFAPDCLEP